MHYFCRNVLEISRKWYFWQISDTFLGKFETYFLISLGGYLQNTACWLSLQIWLINRLFYLCVACFRLWSQVFSVQSCCRAALSDTARLLQSSMFRFSKRCWMCLGTWKWDVPIPSPSPLCSLFSLYPLFSPPFCRRPHLSSLPKPIPLYNAYHAS